MKVADKSGHPQTIGLMAATLGAVLFSTKAVLVKLAFTYMVTPETLLSLRLIMAVEVRPRLRPARYSEGAHWLRRRLSG